MTENTKKQGETTTREKTKKRQVGKSGVLWNLFLLLIFLTGAGILVYPTISDMWNTYRSARLMNHYEESVKELPKESYDELWAQAREYNAHHTVNTIVDAFSETSEYELSHPYDTMLDPNGDGLMGSIEIPKIKTKLAIYHGLGKSALERGAGHVEGTSLPIGGTGTHAALAAHRGLPSAKLFTDLDRMEKGDVFYLHILDETLAYEVDQILTVDPTEVEPLALKAGEDDVTLITCTPYGVNSHRLLVRGSRIPYVKEEAEPTQASIPEQLAKLRPEILLVIGLGIVALVILIFVLMNQYHRKKHKKNNQRRNLQKRTGNRR